MQQHTVRILALLFLPLLWGTPLAAGNAAPADLHRLMQTLDIQGCEHYPHGESKVADKALNRFKKDLQQAVTHGLQCLAGQGPMGKLHSYHEEQGRRLQSLLESATVKTFLCVEDEIYADAVATQLKPLPETDGLSAILHRVNHPAVVLDVYRIGGLLSRRYSVETYRQFFQLDDSQIKEHLTGNPLQMDSSHRYRNMPALLFHEMVHWLGHSHSYIHPDVTTLYETCCFGGSDYIRDEKLNREFQLRACDILRDDELWHANNYQKVRLWHHKGYDQLKGEMRRQADTD